jgi:hypothetical protein
MIVDTQYAFVNILVVVFPLLLPFRFAVRLFLFLFWFTVWHVYFLFLGLLNVPLAIFIPLLKLLLLLDGIVPPPLAYLAPAL